MPIYEGRGQASAIGRSSARSIIEVGRGVKFYEEDHHGFGRQDATCLRVDNDEGVIDLRCVLSNRRINNVSYVAFIDNDIDSYWVDLPVGYVPGSEGH